MKHHQKDTLRTRRDFLRQTSCAALGVTSLVNALAHLRLMTAAMAQGAPEVTSRWSFYSRMAATTPTICLVPHQRRGLIAGALGLRSGPRRAHFPAADLHPLTVPATTRAFNLHYGGQAQPLGFHRLGRTTGGVVKRRQTRGGGERGRPFLSGGIAHRLQFRNRPAAVPVVLPLRPTNPVAEFPARPPVFKRLGRPCGGASARVL